MINFKISCSFINFFKFFSIHIKFFFKILDVWFCIYDNRLLIDWSEQCFDNFKALNNIFFARNLVSLASNMQSSESSTAQNFVVVAAEVFSWLIAWIVFSIKSKQLRLAQPFYKNIGIKFTLKVLALNS